MHTARLRRFGLLAWAGLALTAPSQAQIDPEPRRLVHFGYDQTLSGPGPTAGYLFYYLNEPHFPLRKATWRAAIAPTYLDSELGLAGALGPHTDLGLGLAGGGFANSYSEVRSGDHVREDSFLGHGAGAALSAYHLFNPGRQIPLYGVCRASVQSLFYEKDRWTAQDFALPRDRTSVNLRTGLRFGGQEPFLDPLQALEISAWHQSQLRLRPDSYGYAGDRSLEAYSHLFWGRILFNYRSKASRHFSGSLTLGTSLDPDRMSAYKLGGLLPLTSEFPLGLPGYYTQELSARRFALLNARYAFPLDRSGSWLFNLFAAGASISYLPGLDQRDRWHSGVGCGIEHESYRRVWNLTLNYGYGIRAIRSGRYGAHSLTLLAQWDRLAGRQAAEEKPSPAEEGRHHHGLRWIPLWGK
ncbi:MAG: hypothetical protein WC881_05280 [Elusimicrobiota bacterium]|jgi:hypothetical protein